MKDTALALKLKRLIERDGPLTISEFMRHCLSDPEHGYYMSANPFGENGDFVTAPEVSQLFGELLGGWTLNLWREIGSPSHFHLVEIGPGRGTLMSDVMRVLRLSPACSAAVNIHLVETSPRLRKIQEQTLAARPPLNAAPTHWASHIGEIPDDAPIIALANELFDALPIHQYVKTPEGWFERVVGLDANGVLCFGQGPGPQPENALPEAIQTNSAEIGAIFETQPQGDALAQTIAERLTRQGGAALFIDYGYVRAAVGDSLQALRKHKMVSPLEHIGDADLTAHVNFESLVRASATGGAQVHGPLTQGAFLLKLGLLERAGALGAGKSHAEQERIRNQVERLAAPQQMGDLFKVVALSAPQNRLSLFPFDS